MYMQFVCPMFMWSKSVKEAKIFQDNFKESMQMIYEGEKQAAEGKPQLPDDGRPERMSRSSVAYPHPIKSTSKYLQPDDEEDRMS